MFTFSNESLSSLILKFKIFLKLLIIPSILGMIIGFIAVLFSYTLTFVTQLRINYPQLIYLLPFAGLLIIFSYHRCKIYNPKGTNLVISSIRSDESIPFVMAPLIFLGTVLTHLTGGSSGREGAALQLGGSIAHSISKKLNLNEKDIHIMTMCGMSAGFSALFGTPLAATIFSMEVISVGIMHYAALVPCTFSALSAFCVAKYCGLATESFTIIYIPNFSLIMIIKIIILGILCAFLSILFCSFMHKTHQYLIQWFKNQYIRIFFGGSIVVLLTLIFGNDYNGTGMTIIEKALEGKVIYYAFLLKILFTSLTLESGYKGGEIVPTLFIGATFGCMFGHFINLSPSLCAALGMSATFCGVTNCPITSLLLGFELFGYNVVAYFLIIISISYLLSGYNGLYNAQKIMYSKYSTVYINQTTNH